MNVSRGVKHNPDSPFLIGGHMPGDIVCEAIQKSWIDRQIRFVQNKDSGAGADPSETADYVWWT